ncbi:MAG: helix-turn-helix transcriptional regulator [Eubacteriales bacterium]
MNDYAFGNFLYALRTEKGFSQSQLGNMLGVTNKAVSKWENGSAKPNTSLIPEIAKILDVTVEELFACKKFEKNCELENIKLYLLAQKKKYAILSSIFLSALIIFPLLLIEFICVVMGFKLPDDIAGPLGAVGFIFTFALSLVLYIIYRGNFKNAWIETEPLSTPAFAKENRIILSICAITISSLFAILFPVYFLISKFSGNFNSANIFLCIAVFLLILLLGIIICFTNIKRLLKIKFDSQTEQGKKHIHFSNLPIWCKVCYITATLLLPVVSSILILGYLNGGWFIAKFISIAVFFACIFAVFIYNVCNAKKK